MKIEHEILDQRQIVRDLQQTALHNAHVSLTVGRLIGGGLIVLALAMLFLGVQLRVGNVVRR